MPDILHRRGMQVTGAPPAMQAALHGIGARQAQEWLQRAGQDGGRMPEGYRAHLAR